MAEKSSCTLSEELSTELQALQAIYSVDGEFTQETSELSDYTCVITLTPSNFSTGLQLSIPDSYPDTCPKIEFPPSADKSQGGGLSDSTLAELLQYLYQVAADNKGAPMCYIFVEAAKDWLENRETDTAEGTGNAAADKVRIVDNDAQKLVDDQYETHHKKIKKVKGHKKPHEEEKTKGKKPRMKTATEVISRILWDEQLSSDHFTIGYLDRFLGVIEKRFSAFSWEDIASVDYDTLAIPKHRIQYFKYKDDIVWDKTRRLDNVFGSTGSSTTIIDVINNYQKENTIIEEKESDESINEDVSSEEDSNGGDDDETPSRKRQSNRPNYFIAIRISNKDIVEQVERIQTELCHTDESLESTCSSLRQLHVTLCTLRLEDASEKERAVTVLKELQSTLKSILAPETVLQFQSLQTFHDRVLCTVPQYNLTVVKLADRLCSAMDSAGICIVGTPHSFTPHLTILKITRKQIKQGHRGYLNHRLYEKHIETDFGMQNVDCIHLCSMLDAPSADGFYQSLASMDVLPENQDN